MIVLRFITSYLIIIWYYTIFKSGDIACLRPLSFNQILLILWIRKSLRFICLFKFLKILINRTQFVFAFGGAKDEAPHSNSFDLYRTTSITRHTTCFSIFLRAPLVQVMTSVRPVFNFHLIWSLLVPFPMYLELKLTNIKTVVVTYAIGSGLVTFQYIRHSNGFR